jgi:hypothetical protein
LPLRVWTAKNSLPPYGAKALKPSPASVLTLVPPEPLPRGVVAARIIGGVVLVPELGGFIIGAKLLQNRFNDLLFCSRKYVRSGHVS